MDELQNKVVKIEAGNVIIHCVMSPENGEMTNAVVIETANKLVVVDTLLYRPYAQELRQYADSLGKPIDRVFITHAHPDHWFGSEYFADVPLYALQETIDEINAQGDFYIGYHRSQRGDLATDKKTVPTNAVTEGNMVIDGVTFGLMKIINAEVPVMLAVELPKAKTLFAQDLIYNGVYLVNAKNPVNGDYNFDGWIAALQRLQVKGYETVIPGHGMPADGTVLAKVIEYLDFAKQTFFSAADGEELKQRLLAKYPDYKVPWLLDISNFFLYGPPTA